MSKIYAILPKLKSNRLIKDSLWSLMGNIVGRGLSLITGVLVARYLGKDIFGEYGIIKNTIMTIAVFSSFGLGYTSTKFVAELKKSKPEMLKLFILYALRITLVFCGFMAALLFFFADYIAITILEAPHLNIALQLLAVLIVFNGLTTTQIGILSGFGRFKELAKINAIIGIITFITTVVLTYFYALNGALFALLVTQIANWFLNYLLVKGNMVQLENEVSESKTLFKEIFKFSTPIALQEMTYSASNLISILLLIRFASYGDLGMYNAAMQWNAIVLFIPGILRNVILSHLSENNDDSKEHDKILKTTIIINIVSTLLPAIIIYLFSGFIEGFYGNTFQGLSLLVSIAVFSTVFISISNVYTQAFMSKGYNWTMFAIRLLRDLGIIVSFLIAIHYTGFDGARIMIFNSFIISAITTFIIVMTYKKLKWHEYN